MKLNVKDFLGFLKNNWLLILVAVAIIAAVLLVSSNQTAFMRKEMEVMKAKVDALQADISEKQKAIDGIDTSLKQLSSDLTRIDTDITTGEANYQNLMNQLGDVKALINPPIVVFDSLAACKSSFEDLQKRFSLSIQAINQREIDFKLCQEKNNNLADTVKNLNEKCTLQEGISNGYKQQYETAKQTLTQITKTWKWKTIAGNVADAGMIAGAGALLQKGNWKAAAGVVAARYVAKLIFKI
jgi:predicted  nucleic acid-binding Zn-ribbon protein